MTSSNIPTKRIVFTGGGTAGHVMPNLPLMDIFKQEGWKIDYLGSGTGIEKGMIEQTGIPFHSISSGKLRRYFSLKNFSDPFKILLGIIQSFMILRSTKPQIVFSKGGFVAFPVVVGAWLNRIPVIAHESDMTVGLANKLSFPFVDTLCVTFEAAKKYFKNQEKVFVTGTPVRKELFEGNRERGLVLCGFNTDKPCLLIIGGSLGANSINTSIREALPQLLEKFQIIHLCGKGKVDITFKNQKGYCQFEYIDKELPDLFACADLVISRSGANSLYEILALNKPHILVPLSLQISRGDQIQNAKYFEQKGVSLVIQDEKLTKESLLDGINQVIANRDSIIKKIQDLKIASATDTIVTLLKKNVFSPRQK